jgi:dihydroflavonol-4-reductase
MIESPIDEFALEINPLEKPGPEATILVTGGTGLLGSHIIQRLVEQGKTVKALYRSHIPAIKGKEKVIWVKGDILDVVRLEEVLKEVSYVYHCAAIVSYTAKRRNELFKTNMEGTSNIVNAALNAGVKKLCFVSSISALGKTRDGNLINEDVPWSEETNKSNYGKSKYLAEMEVWRGIGEGLPAVIVNPSIILGAGNWNDSSTKIFKTAYEEFPWYTEGVTGFVDVEDVVSAMIQLMESNISGERFLLNGENKTYKEIFTLAANAFAKKPPGKKVSKLMANVVWRVEAIKSLLTGKEPLLTKETADAAQSVHYYDNSKLKSFLPSFTYTPINETVKRVCAELSRNVSLPKESTAYRTKTK